MNDDGVFSQAAGLAKALYSEFAEFAAPVTQGDQDDHEPVLAPGDEWLVEYDRRITDDELRTATRKLFVDGHYSNAVEDGIKALNECVRLKSGSVLDGDKLMSDVFRPDAPKLRIPDKLTSDNAKSEQRGQMMLCCGVVAAWRNPRAHKLMDDEPDKTVMMLEVVQHLMEISRAATRTKPKKKAAAKKAAGSGTS